MHSFKLWDVNEMTVSDSLTLTQMPPFLVLLELSTLTKLQPGKLSLESSSGKLDSKYVSEMHVISNLSQALEASSSNKKLWAVILLRFQWHREK